MRPQNWPALRERHAGFWRRAPAERPLRGVKRTTAFVLGDYTFTVTDRPLTPADIDTPQVLEWAEALYRRGEGFLDGELVWGAPPLPGVPWMEAILGCPVRVSAESRSLWAEPSLQDWEEVERAWPLSSNPWFLRLLELTEAMVRQAGDRYPVTQTVMRGPSDLLAALLGHERFCLALIDHPEQVRRLAGRVTDLWLEVAQAQMALIPPFDGGYTPPRLEVWAPGRAVRVEEDATILISLPLYKRYFQECDRRIASAFEYVILHTHSANFKLIPGLLEIEELPALQFLIDPGGPPVEHLRPVLRQIQDKKPLLITHELDGVEEEALIQALSPAGLALERMLSS